MTPEQESFEAWVKIELPSASLESGAYRSTYLNTLVEMAWRGWQAALASHAPSEVAAQPICVGYEGQCEGNLPGESHAPNCPLAEHSDH